MNNGLKVNIYRKPTHSDRYLNFHSDHPLQHKRSVVRALFHRANNLISEEADIKNEKAHIRNVLAVNAYPKWIFNEKSNDRNVAENNETRGFAVLPFIPGFSDKLKNVLMRHQIKVIHKPALNIGTILNNHKDKSNLLEKVGVVYSIPCKNCELQYIGETKRKFETRRSEHQRDIKNSKIDASALAKHILTEKHEADWKQSKILCYECDFYKRRFIESFYINSLDNVMNDKNSVDFPNIYKNLFK